MFNTKYSKKEKKFLIKNLKKLRSYLKKKNPNSNVEEDKLISNFMDFKISTKDINKINKLKLLKEKKLKDSLYFKITELGESNEAFYKSNRLYEYTKNNWLFQKQAFEEDSIKSLKYVIKREYPDINEDSEEYIKIKNKKIKKIMKTSRKQYGENYENLYLFGTWCRWIEDNSLQYGVIESVENYFLEKVNKIIDKKTNSYIPSCLTHYPDKEWIPNNNNTSTWNIETRANGREEELVELRKKLYVLELNFVKDNLNYLLKDLSGKTFKKSVYSDGDELIHLYVPDIKTSKLLSSKNFLVDFYKLEQPFDIIKQNVKKVIKEKKLKEQIHSVYLENYKKYNK